MVELIDGGAEVRRHQLRIQEALQKQTTRSETRDAGYQGGSMKVHPLRELAELAGLRLDFRGDRIPPVMRFVLAHPAGSPGGEEAYNALPLRGSESPWAISAAVPYSSATTGLLSDPIFSISIVTSAPP